MSKLYGGDNNDDFFDILHHIWSTLSFSFIYLFLLIIIVGSVDVMCLLMLALAFYDNVGPLFNDVSLLLGMPSILYYFYWF